MEYWGSRRSPVLTTKGVCSSSQPYASAAGIKFLSAGGTAADAAVAMAAVLNVVEPCCTGIGGDSFALFYDKQSPLPERVSCFLGNGKSPENLTLDYVLGSVAGRSVILFDISNHIITWISERRKGMQLTPLVD